MKSVPLYKQIIHDILKQIYSGELRPGDRIPSEHDLSDQYLVSSITSKNALAELADKGFIVRIKGKGSFVNTEEVLQSIAEYTDSVHSQTIMKSKTIGLILPSMKTSIDQQLLDAIEKELSKTEYVLALIITRENQQLESEAIHKLTERGASGLIIFPTEHEMYNESILKLNLNKFPFVLIDRYLKGIRANCVYTNNYEITKEVISQMLTRSNGNIAFISPDSNNSVTADRLSGFQDAMFSHNIVLGPENLCMIDLSITAPEDKMHEIFTFLNNNPDIHSLFCANKEMASYVYQILYRKNLLESYQLCTFDVPDYPHFSYIRQNIQKIAFDCVSILMNQINGNIQYQTSIVPAEYIIT